MRIFKLVYVSSVAFSVLSVALFLQLAKPNLGSASHTAPGAWVEDPAITGCNHCHNVVIAGGNANGSNRTIAYSPSNGSSFTGSRRNNWSSAVTFMIGKGSPSTSAATAYLNACYYVGGTNPNPQGVSCLAVADTESPTQPTNVVGTPDGTGSQISLTWSPSTDNVGVTGYNIYRDYGLTPIGSSASTSYTDTGLSPETAYTYEVEAYDAAGNKSPKSAPIQVTTASLPSDTVPPSQPQNLTGVSNIMGDKVFLTWNPSTDNIRVASYNIYRDSTMVGSSTSPTFLDSGTAPATTYSYEVEAVDSSDNTSPKSVLAVIVTNPGSVLINATVVCTMPETGIVNFVVAPNFAGNNGSLFVVTGDNSIYKCTDSGGTWTRSGNLWPYSGFPYNDIPSYDVKMLAITPNFASNNRLFAAAGLGIYISTNGGSSWGQSNVGLYGFNMTSVSVSPNYASDNTVYSGNWKDFPGQGGGLQTWDPMIYKSTNGGASWSFKKTLTSAGEGTGFTSIAISTNNHVYAGVAEAGTTYKGVWRSTNGGTSWIRVQSVQNVSDIAISPNYATDCTVFSVGDTQEIYRSTDCGDTWTPIAANDNPGFSIDAIAVSPDFGTDGDALFCSSGAGSSNYGLKRSIDGGLTWNDAAFQGAGCTDVHYAPDFSSGSGLVFVSDDTKVYQLEAITVPDGDGDGWDPTVDCNDSDNSIYPGATEIPNDGIDQDCNGTDLFFKLINISTRARVQTGDNVVIGGFWISGTAPKTVLIRARGPSLAAFGVPTPLANPTIQLYSGPTVIAQNNDWQTTDSLCGSPAVACGDATDIQNTGLDPCSVTSTGCTLDSALLVTLPPGGYTSILSGVSGGMGIGIVEVFEADTVVASRLVNISTRARVQTGDNVMIGGFWISGTAPKTVLIRARGPSLAAFGVPTPLANPTIQLYSGPNMITQNNDWQTTDSLCDPRIIACGDATDIQNTGLDPCSVTSTGCTLDSALLVTLNPGGYTAILSGVSGGTGIGIVEVFEAD